MRVIANCQLAGSYGLKLSGHEFDCPDDIAGELLRMGSVRKPDPPKILYSVTVKDGKRVTERYAEDGKTVIERDIEPIAKEEGHG